MGASLPHSYFSTRRLDADARFGAWRDQISAVFDPRLPEGGTHRFEAHVNGYLFGPVSQMRGISSRQHFTRDRRKIDADSVDNYMIQIFRRGGCIANTARGEVRMGAGDICIFDNAQPLDSYNTDFDLLALFVPRDLLAPLIANPDGRHVSSIQADAPMAIVLRNHLLALHENAPTLSPEDAELLIQPTLALLAATLNSAPDSVEGGESAVRLAIGTTLKRHIDQNLADPGLDTEMLAGRFGISRTRLYRLFAAHDGVASYIRNRRLGAAMTILRDPRQQHRKIIDIAHTVGFGSEGSFIRAFRRRYGHTPAESRLGAGDGMGAALLSDAGDTSWRDWMRSI